MPMGSPTPLTYGSPASTSARSPRSAASAAASPRSPSGSTSSTNRCTRAPGPTCASRPCSARSSSSCARARQRCGPRRQQRHPQQQDHQPGRLRPVAVVLQQAHPGRPRSLIQEGGIATDGRGQDINALLTDLNQLSVQSAPDLQTFADRSDQDQQHPDQRRRRDPEPGRQPPAPGQRLHQPQRHPGHDRCQRSRLPQVHPPGQSLPGPRDNPVPG